jgi:pilus assembly protein Flp/PilA
LTDFADNCRDKSVELRIPKAGGDHFAHIGPRGNWIGPWLKVSEQPMLKLMKNFVSDDSGVTAIEYALIASLIAVFIIVAVQLVGTQVSTVFTEVGKSLK